MDYGKFKFDAAQRAKESRRKAVHVGIKEMKYRPKIGPGDFDTKTRQVAKFLDEGHKVKITIMFRGREVFHPELGKKILDRIADQMDGMGKPESVPRLDGRNMVMVLAPDKRAKQSAASRGPRSSNADKAANQAAPATAATEEALRDRSIGQHRRQHQQHQHQQRQQARRNSGAEQRPRPRRINSSTAGTRDERVCSGADRDTTRREIADMPKMKTDSGAAKRIKVTGTGRLRRRKAFRSHLLEKKSSVRTRRLGRETDISRRPQADPPAARSVAQRVELPGCPAFDPDLSNEDPARQPASSFPPSIRPFRRSPPMARVKRAVHGKKHHRAVLEQAQGYYGNKSRSYRVRQRAGDALAAVRLPGPAGAQRRLPPAVDPADQRGSSANGMSYSRFIAGLRVAEVTVDRKVLADLAVREPEAFASLVTVANEALAAEKSATEAAS